ncbi:MAG: hypothetical protein EP344_11260 [Bacteroidetes bacterium]|nr:MAG: hypothetical protein EP344_11260 [Bacteroidota bacterium]
MLNSELVFTLQVLSADERARLEWFLISPYCTDGKDGNTALRLVQHVFNVLDKGEPEMADLDRTIVYAVLYPGRKFAKQTLNNLVTMTLQWVRQFLMQEMTNRSMRPVERHAKLANYFRGKGDQSLTAKYLNRLERERLENNSMDDEDYWQAWVAEDAKSQFLGMQTDFRGEFNLRESLQAIDQFYLVKRLSILMSLFNQHRLAPVFAPGEQEACLQELDRWFAKPEYDQPLLQLYRQAILALHHENEAAEQAFETFITLLAKHEKDLSWGYINDFKRIAYNFCVRKYSIPKYKEKLFEIFEDLYLTQYRNSNQLIQANEFLSVLKTALIRKQFGFVEDFLRQHRHSISGGHPSEEYYRFGLAFYYFYQERFDESRALIVQLNFRDYLFKYVSKTLEIKIFFETGEDDYELVDSSLNALKVAVHREKNMSSDKVDSLRNFVRFARRLYNWVSRPNQKKEVLHNLLQQAKDAPELFERTWLVSKIRVLLGEG